MNHSVHTAVMQESYVGQLPSAEAVKRLRPGVELRYEVDRAGRIIAWLFEYEDPAPLEAIKASLESKPTSQS